MDEGRAPPSALTALRSSASHCWPVSCSLYCWTSHVSAPARYDPSALLSSPSAMEQERITSGACRGGGRRKVERDALGRCEGMVGHNWSHS